MARKKTWAEKFSSAEKPHVTVLGKPFAGLNAGQRLFIASPAMIREYMDAIPHGETRDIAAIGAEFAKAKRAHGTSPLTTGIFARIVAETALEARAAGQAEEEGMTPFWRLIDPKSPLAKKLSCGPGYIRVRRKAELQYTQIS